jgi:zinc-ribbon domain
MDGKSRSCLACRAELRDGARFCPRCGQRVLDIRPDSGDAGFDRLVGPGQTVVSASPAPLSGPRTPPDGTPPRSAPPAADEWSDWYTSTAPRAAYPPPAQPWPAVSPHSPQQPPYQSAPPAPPYQPPGYAQPPAYGPPGFEPFLPYQPPRQPAPPPRDNRDRSFGAAAVWVVLALLVVGGGAYALVAQPWKSHETFRDAASTGSPSASSSASASAAVTVRSSHSAAASGVASPAGTAATATAATAATERQAAADVATMLSSSGSDRSAINAAWSDVRACGPNLTGDAKAFTDAAKSRQTLLSSLATMPGRATLPPALLADLTSAWQASIAVDQDYARWTQDEIASSCVPNDTSDANYAAATTPNINATNDKQAFASEWDPIAASYGLTQYQADQL